MRGIGGSKGTALVETLLLIAATIGFVGFAPVERPAGLRTAVELIDRKWTAGAKPAAAAMVREGNP